MELTPAQTAVTEFGSRFGSQPTLLARAPGRVNLIGEHTDYNDGFVLPMAIEHEVVIALRPLDEPVLRLYSTNFQQAVDIPFAALQRRWEGWAAYPAGVARALQESAHSLCGLTGVITGNVPAGAGLSSSAALELAAARALQAIADWDWDPVEMAKLAQYAENHFVGMNCGIMDQLISSAGQAGSALLIDCRSLACTPVALPEGVSVAVLDTGTRRGLVGSAYNDRRRQCEEAARSLGIPALRDISLADFLKQAGGLDEVTFRRARHVVSEDERTLQAVAAIRAGDLRRFGELLDASHVSMRDDFEISNRELNEMVRLAQAHPACWGARMTGGGFGGCAVAVVRSEQAGSFRAEIAKSYQAATGIEPKIYICYPAQGASVEKI
jgi:galactokinase